MSDRRILYKNRDEIQKLRSEVRRLRASEKKKRGSKSIFIAVRGYAEEEDRPEGWEYGSYMDSYDVQTALDVLKANYQVFSHNERWDVIEIISWPQAATTYEGALNRVWDEETDGPPDY